MQSDQEVIVSVVEVTQPIGKFYVGVMTVNDLLAISRADMRKIDSELDDYIGIQRKLSKSRVKEISEFVTSIDATFPTSVVLAVRGECAEYNAETSKLRISSNQELNIPLSETASILDGQHRIEGLKEARPVEFDIPVSIFVDADIADQAYIFATVNLAQTKVNKSLVYDLFDYANARSPQKSAHDITVALDKFEGSPFYKLIKRLGAATPGRSGETLAQATIVNGIIPLISKKPEKDRYDMAKKRKVEADDSGYAMTPFRRLWIDERDGDIAKILLNYFLAVKETWTDAWASRDKGQILVRTNGYRAFIRLFKDIYLKEKPSFDKSNPIVSKERFLDYFGRTKLTNSDFNTTNFAPGTSGETALYKRLKEDLKV